MEWNANGEASGVGGWNAGRYLCSPLSNGHTEVFSGPKWEDQGVGTHIVPKT